MLAVLAALVLAAAAPAPPTSQQVLDTEKAFAQVAAQAGVGPAFRQFAAPDAVMFLPDPVKADGPLSQARWPGELSWRVQYVGAAGSGDLAFSAGPSLLKGPGLRSGGFYLAIWKRQPDGGWKFVVDHGADAPAAVFTAPPQPLTVMNTDAAGAPSGEGMREADGALNVALPRGAEAAFAARLDDQAVLVRTGRGPAAGKKRALTLVTDSPPILEAFTLGAGRSQDGTLGYTYGRARFASGAQGSQLGYYVRVWRSTPQGWRLLIDHLADR